MTIASADLQARYASALRRFLSGDGESALESAYECGRSAMAEGKSLLEMVRLYGEAMEAAVGERPELARSRAGLARGLQFLGESISPFEMTHRGFREANDQLRRLNLELERHGAELAFTNDELQRQIRERAAIEENLRQAQKMESLGTLAGGIAHDFNNLLGIISAHATIVAMREIDLARRENSLSAIQTAVSRGSKLVRQLLTFARKSQPDLAPIAIDAVVEDLATILEETLPRSIRFSTNLERGLPKITADHDQLMQALLNLCVNARDAMPDGGTLTIATDAEDGASLKGRFAEAAAGTYVRIRVVDSGTGIDEAVKERIFEPFFTTKEKGKGVGLGLAVVYGMVTSLDGFVGLESALGRGTTVSLYFPETKLDAFAAAPEPSAPGAESAGRGETILVVEDELVLLDALKILLEFEGYRVLLAADGAEAFALFDQNAGEIDLVISDLGLPGMGGWDVLRELRRRKPGLPGIVASGYLDPAVEREMLGDVVAATLEKPYAAEEVRRKIREVLGAESKQT